MKHANLGASSSSRWLNCPASAKQVLKYKRTTSQNAEQGTCAHELGERCLKDFDKSPHDFIGQKLKDAPSITVDKEMADYVEGYVDYVRSFKGDLFIEERVDYSEWVDAGFGTSDAIVVSDDVCHVIDLKYGKGVEVYADNNSQAMLYALGVISGYGFLYEFEEVQLHIYQPRRDHFDNWTITKTELLKWAEWVRERALLCEDADAPFNPGEKQCHWCAHKANCTALFKHTEQIISSQFDDLDLPSPDEIDVELVLSNKTLIESWLKAVQQNAFDKLSNGEKVKGYKLVAGRTSRKWSDESEAFHALADKYDTDELETRKFISVAQAEKLTGKAKFAEFAELVIKSDGKPTLAPESDKRKAFNDVSCDFDEIS